MKKVLILLAGFPGTGKTYLGELLRRELGEFAQVSQDEQKEYYFDRYGFKDLKEKKKIEKKAWKSYYTLLEEKMSEEKRILSDYPFSLKQKPGLENLADQYGYKVITIRLVADLDVLFERQKQRDLDPSRHLSHIVTSYRKGDVLEDRSQADNLLTYEEFISRCTSRGYDTFAIGALYELDVTDYAKVDYYALVEELRKECN